MNEGTYRRVFTVVTLLLLPVPVFVNFQLNGLLFAPISQLLVFLAMAGVGAMQHSHGDGLGEALALILIGTTGVQVLVHCVLLIVACRWITKRVAKIGRRRRRTGARVTLLCLPVALTLAPLNRPDGTLFDSGAWARESRGRISSWQTLYRHFKWEKANRDFNREMPGWKSLEDLARQGKYGEAERVARRMVAVERERERAQFGTERSQTAGQLRRLAWILNVQGKHAEAEKAMRDADTIIQEHQQTQMAAEERRMGSKLARLRFPGGSKRHSMELAALLSSQGRHEEAERLLRNNLAHATRQADEIGPYRRGGAVARFHLIVEEALYTLADELREQGRYDETEALCREAMVVRKRLLQEMKKAGERPMGNQIPGELRNQLVLARTRRDREDYEAAESLFIRVAAATRPPYRIDNPDLPSVDELAAWEIPPGHFKRMEFIGALIGLAESLRRQEDYETALTLAEKVMASGVPIQQGHRDLIEILETMAGIHSGLGNDEQAAAFRLWAGSAGS